MANKPKITIDNFKGMKPGSAYFLQGFTPRLKGQQSVLTPLYDNSNLVDSSDTGYSNLGIIQGMTNTVFDNRNKVAGIDDAGQIFISDNTLISTFNIGEVKDISDTRRSYNPDIISTKNETLFYTTEQYLGAAFRFTATSATSTSLTVSGKTFFSTYGIDDDAHNGTIYNLTKEEQYVNTTSEPTDTLNFSAANTTPESGDEFLVFVDDYKEFITSTSRDIHFNGQGLPNKWIRQFTNFGNDYYITNGNYLSVIQSDESTFAKQEKSLPDRIQATCISSNAERIIVGGNRRGKGKILTWDGESDFWKNSIDLPSPPEAIIPYQGTFLMVSNGILYQTNGYDLKKIVEIPDVTKQYGNNHYNGLLVLGNQIFIVNNKFSYNRCKKGVYVYELDKDSFSFIPYSTEYEYPTNDINGGAMYYASDEDEILLGVDKNINAISRDIDSSSLDTYYVQYKLNLPRRTRINKVELNLSLPDWYVENSNDLRTDVTVSIGDGNHGLYRLMTFGSASTTTTLVSTNETNYDVNAKIGEQLEIVDSNSHLNSAGEKRFITSITDPDTSSVDYVINKAISNAPTASVTGFLYKLKRTHTETIQSQSLDLSDNLVFPVDDFYSDKIIIEILFDKSSSGSIMGLNINSINIY